MKILIVDNNIDHDCWGASDLVRLARLAAGAEIHVRRGPHADLPPTPKPFDRIIVSGSKTSALDQHPWTEKLDGFLKVATNNRQHVLGICYGHQALARALRGYDAVRKCANPEFGWTQIVADANASSLWVGLEPEFYSFSSHFDEVWQLPRGARSIASSRDCMIQAFELESAPIYGIQFHPEKTAEEGERTLTYRKKLGSPKHLLHAGRSNELYDAKVGATIFKNFLIGGGSST